ncbi:hypothetical protein, partial [Plantactinospora alkalitolerans]
PDHVGHRLRPPLTMTRHDPGGSMAEAVGAMADSAAGAAARAAGVTVRHLADLAELRAVHRLYEGIWRPDPTNPPVTMELLRALAKAGNYVAGAYDGGLLVGACVGFFGPPRERSMHSHIAGVSGAALGRNVGFALKLHQRAWALRRGVATIAWTFDPLVCRNAYFNLSKLAAVPAQYLPNFYGAMNDGINGNDDTDRLLVSWELAAATVVAACARSLAPRDVEVERAAGAVVALGRSARNRPATGRTDGNVLLVAVPADIATVRRTDPGAAREWRVAVRGVLAPLMAEGARVVGFDRSGWYVVTRETREDSR